MLLKALNKGAYAYIIKAIKYWKTSVMEEKLKKKPRKANSRKCTKPSAKQAIV